MKEKKKRVRRPPSVGVRSGVVAFETRPTTEQRARAYAAMIEKNPLIRASFTQVEKVKGKWVVCWLPGDDAKRGKVFVRFQEEQAARAREEGATWQWTLQSMLHWTQVTFPEEGKVDSCPIMYAWVYTLDIDEKTGEIGKENEYQLSYTGSGWLCQCPQFEYRCRHVGADCKHICGLNTLLEILHGLILTVVRLVVIPQFAVRRNLALKYDMAWPEATQGRLYAYGWKERYGVTISPVPPIYCVSHSEEEKPEEPENPAIPLNRWQAIAREVEEKGIDAFVRDYRDTDAREFASEHKLGDKPAFPPPLPPRISRPSEDYGD
jgi:hypothetical protein